MWLPVTIYCSNAGDYRIVLRGTNMNNSLGGGRGGGGKHILV